MARCRLQRDMLAATIEGGSVTIWKRLLITIIAMLVASLVVGLLWRGVFDARIPSYLSGLIGGMSALAVWEFLRAR